MAAPKFTMPSGVVLVFVNESGRHVANAACFKQSASGGYRLEDAQRLRARRSLARAVVDAYASRDLARAIDDYTAETIMDKLVREHGCHVALVNVRGEA